MYGQFSMSSVLQRVEIFDYHTVLRMVPLCCTEMAGCGQAQIPETYQKGCGT